MNPWSEFGYRAEGQRGIGMLRRVSDQLWLAPRCFVASMKGRTITDPERVCRSGSNEDLSRKNTTKKPEHSPLLARL